MHVVATAGHVDHGKSTLIRTLTGIDPDRLAEEQERGLTIDLGFAWATLPSGRETGFVDVPGHVRFLKNMLAGVGAVDAVLFVVAATEGWKPQSEEHLRILEVLGATRGLIALTKVAGLDADDVELARLLVADQLSGSFLEDAAIVAVDAPTGAGVGDLTAALDELLAVTPEATDSDRPRLWVDRSFAARGSGTVVTGTLTGGSIGRGDQLALLAGARVHEVRVRALQTHGAPVERAAPGRRLAVNLTGVDAGEVARGDALVRAPQWHRTTTVDASLTVLPSLDHDVARRGAHLAYLGSGEHPVALRVLGADAIRPGETRPVRIHLPVPLPLQPGDRFVLRESGRSETIGGGEILDVAPIVSAARARPDRSVARIVRERGWVDADDLERLTGGAPLPPEVLVVDGWVTTSEQLDEIERRLLDAAAAAGTDGLDVATLDVRERAVLTRLDAGRITVEGGRARSALVSTAGAGDVGTSVGEPVVEALAAAPFRPPAVRDLGASPVEVRRLVERGLVVERDGLHFAASAVDEAARIVAGLLETSPDGVTASEVREALDTTRKYLLPLLGILDATGVTRRRGDVRIAGPRLPSGGG